jgi:hypothetical protein
MVLQIGDAVYVAAGGFIENNQNPRTAEAYIIRFDRDKVWIAITSRIPLSNLWASYPIKLYYDAGKEPFADGINYQEYNFEDDQLFYLVPYFTLHSLDKPSLTQEQKNSFDNKLDQGKKKLKLLGQQANKRHVNYILALARHLDIQQGYPVLPLAPAAAPAAEEDPEEPVVNEENPQNLLGGFRRKSKRKTNKRKTSKRKNKKTRKH